jgi:hypothetical protein
MATWGELQERVRRDFALDEDSTDEFSLTLERRVGSSMREQRVMVHRYDGLGNEMVEVRSAFRQVDGADLEALLRESLRLPIGGIALHGRYLVVVTKAVLADTTVDGVLFLLTRVGMLADVLEERMGGDRF